MTGVTQNAYNPGLTDRGAVSARTEPLPKVDTVRPRQDWSARIEGWGGVGWLACGLIGSLAVIWFIFFSPAEIGSRAEWFFGACVLVVAMVAMWQTRAVERRAEQQAAAGAERLRTQLTAAAEHSARELALAQKLHRTELEAQQALHRAEMDSQRELARADQLHLRQQLQRQAMIEVSRGVREHAHMLATLWNHGASILLLEDRDAREEAMRPIFEQIGQVVTDFSIELGNAHLLVEDANLNQALDSINEAALMAIHVAEDVHVAVLEGSAPQPNPVPPVQRLMHTRAAEARRLAWDLIRTGLSDDGSQTKPE